MTCNNALRRDSPHFAPPEKRKNIAEAKIKSVSPKPFDRGALTPVSKTLQMRNTHNREFLRVCPSHAPSEVYGEADILLFRPS
jgi:hypothetical protein